MIYIIRHFLLPVLRFAGFSSIQNPASKNRLYRPAIFRRICKTPNRLNLADSLVRSFIKPLQKNIFSCKPPARGGDCRLRDYEAGTNVIARKARVAIVDIATVVGIAEISRTRYVFQPPKRRTVILCLFAESKKGKLSIGVSCVISRTTPYNRTVGFNLAD